MHWQSFAQTATGETHRQKNLPCQDCAEAVSLANAHLLIAADGHGNRRHFRSERGSRFACEAAKSQITALLAGLDENERIAQEKLDALQADIQREWRTLVAADLAQSPWTEEELAEEQALLTPDQYTRLTEGQSDLVPYGSTLVAAFVTEQCWACIQIGDGMMVIIDREGGYHWPMPESRVNLGSRTSSLCSETPEVRLCMGPMPIAGLVVCTDGLEKAFPTQGEKIVRALYLLWSAARETPENACQRLASAAEQIATLSIVKDDVGFAVLADCDAEDVTPKPTEAQQRRQAEQLQGKWDELVSIIEFNQRQLAASQNPDDIARLQESIAQCRKDLLTLMEICPDKTKFQLPLTLMENAPVSTPDRKDEPEEEEPKSRQEKPSVSFHGFAALLHSIARGFNSVKKQPKTKNPEEPAEASECHSKDAGDEKQEEGPVSVPTSTAMETAEKTAEESEPAVPETPWEEPEPDDPDEEAWKRALLASDGQNEAPDDPDKQEKTELPECADGNGTAAETLSGKVSAGAAHLEQYADIRNTETHQREDKRQNECGSTECDKNDPGAL